MIKMLSHMDSISALFASRRTRRGAVLTGVGLAALPLRGGAQEATPTGMPTVVGSSDPHPSVDTPAYPEMLFVQPFAGGTWAPKSGEDGVYTLTLSGAAAQTVYFSDRPAREFGLAPTQQFLDNLGFTPADPPNAAVVARTADGAEQEVLLIELLNPAYDGMAGTLTYDAKVLADYGEPGLAHAARQQTDFTLPETFAEGGLFIDDCTNGDGYCYQEVTGQRVIVGNLQVPTCGGLCELCGNSTDPHYGKICHDHFPDRCNYYTNGIQGWDCFGHIVESDDDYVP